MVAGLGEVAYDRQQGQFLIGGQRPSWLERNYAEETAREIDCAVRALVARAAERGTCVLEAHRGLLERGARALLEKETLSMVELQELVSDAGKVAVLPGAAAAAAAA
jgi:cell division protease FtsH